ncbi:MAG: aldo/keto reductase [Clostridium sp.]
MIELYKVFIDIYRFYATVIYSLDSNLHNFSLNKSLNNLNLSTIDIMYIHNPEMAMSILGKDLFFYQLENLMNFYENKVNEGKIKFYGMATWFAFRVSEDNPMHISLEQVVDLAQKVGGKNHHFKFIQLPYNIKDTTAATKPTQKLNGKYFSAIDAANKLGLYVTISAPLNQCNDFKATEFKPSELINYVIKTEGVYAAMVGSKQRKNLIKNLHSVL